MASSTPVRESLGGVRRQPAVFFVELAWRWSFGLAALAILAYGASRYLGTLALTEADIAALNSGNPELAAQVVARIVQSSGAVLARIAIMVAVAMAAVWVLLAAVGRAATLRRLLGKSTLDSRSLFGLSLLRATLALASGLAVVLSAVVAGIVAGGGTEPSPAVFLLVFLTLLTATALTFSVGNWYLSLAPVLAVREGRGTLRAVRDTLTSVRRHRPAFTGTSMAFASVRLVVVAVFTVISLLPLALLGSAPSWLVATLLVLLAFAYFAVSDFLYVARLAAYIGILQEGSAAVAQEGEAVPAHARL